MPKILSGVCDEWLVLLTDNPLYMSKSIYCTHGFGHVCVTHMANFQFVSCSTGQKHIEYVCQCSKLIFPCTHFACVSSVFSQFILVAWLKVICYNTRKVLFVWESALHSWILAQSLIALLFSQFSWPEIKPIKLDHLKRTGRNEAVDFYNQSCNSILLPVFS